MENTLFEAGKLLSKHLTFLVSSLILLVLLISNVDGKEVIKVPIISFELKRHDAIAVVLLFYYFTLYKFFSVLYYQFYLVFEYIKENEKNDIYRLLYPSSFNFIMFHHYMSPNEHVPFNKNVVIGTALVIMGLPFWSALYLGYVGVSKLVDEGINIHSILYLLILFSTIPIIKWVKEHMSAIKVHSPKNKT